MDPAARAVHPRLVRRDDVLGPGHRLHPALPDPARRVAVRHRRMDRRHHGRLDGAGAAVLAALGRPGRSLRAQARHRTLVRRIPGRRNRDVPGPERVDLHPRPRRHGLLVRQQRADDDHPVGAGSPRAAHGSACPRASPLWDGGPELAVPGASYGDRRAMRAPPAALPARSPASPDSTSVIRRAARPTAVRADAATAPRRRDRSDGGRACAASRRAPDSSRSRTRRARRDRRTRGSHPRRSVRTPAGWDRAVARPS